MNANLFLIFYNFIRIIFFIINFIKRCTLSENNVSYRLFLFLHFPLQFVYFIFNGLHKTFLLVVLVTVWAAECCRVAFEKILFLMLHLVFQILFLLLFWYFFLNDSFVNTFTSFLNIIHGTCNIICWHITFKVFLF